MPRTKPLILTILDGWGFSATTEGNAIAAARKPNYDQLLRDFPNTLVHTSGPYVGLPDGQMGNSEVGHLNIGAGRVIHMDVTRLDHMIATGEFFQNQTLLASMNHARSAGHRLHLMGLCSDGGVHSHLGHLYALLKMAKQQEVGEVFLHCFMDGRDTPPQSGIGYIREIQQHLDEIGLGKIASVEGRYYAMDRDKRWERIDRAFNAMVTGKGEKATGPVEVMQRSYERDITDEFIEPVTIVDKNDQPVGLIRDDDACIFFNYRADRGREMTEALTRDSVPHNLHFTTMTQYDRTLPVPFVLSKEPLDNILANVFAQLNWKNLRVAETEKYAHVTYFFNGGLEKSFAGEERELVASPKVATYDLKPEMSAEGITNVVIDAMGKKDFDVIIMNFANADMVGHSGKMEPTVRAVETVDACLGRIWQQLRARNGRWIITADHGNAETMIDPVTHGPHTYHTTNPVPFILVDDSGDKLREGGALQDIAPTILSVLGERQPPDMSGHDIRRRT
ncbi:MAG TPA: 2,3-bisphosphoglycerate-independent phosphoglycerate mutase [Bryobacteraceae bacterium]|nr:2,3-bisphosphoglycerate-independent phosphoglycerate mutase [Bryobacteraceae bacterium]